MEHYASGDEVLLINSIEKEEENADESDTVQQIKKLLETRVRPAVVIKWSSIMFIQTEDTPNPLTIKFLPGKQVMKSGTADFRKKELSENSPLASRLFEVEGVDGVFLGSDFISVTKKKDEEWFSLKPSILGKIMEHYASGDEVLLINSIEKEEENADESDTVQQIKKLLETRVRPAVVIKWSSIMFIQTEDTPNPLTIKFLPGKQVMKSGTADFRKKELSENSPLASRLFEVEGVDGVFLGSDFISVTKKKDEEWFSLKPSILGKIMEHYASGDEVLILNSIEKEEDNADESDTVQQIKKLLETRVRTAVAMDGGDIQFESFEDGIVTLLMKGACSGCPSSTATLKMGIENMLRHYIPEVQEVRASGM